MGRAGQKAEYSLLLGVSPRDTQTPTMSPASSTSGAPLPSVAILGVDALLAARPSTPVQLAHACQAAGYAAVYPATWGDELIAAACMRRVAARGDDPAIFCACPHVSDALLEVGPDLARFLVPLVAPPVACARYLRALYGYNRVRITYIGACPAAHDPAIDATLTPVQFFGVLAQLGIALEEQPSVFESVLPPDRRRHRSRPGGAPTTEMLAIDGVPRTLEEIIEEDWKTELAQRLLLRHRTVFDIAPALGCHCAGARPGVAPEAARPAVVALEPPRASSDVVDLNVAVDVDRMLPVLVSRMREVVPTPIVASPPDEQAPAVAPAVSEPPAPAVPESPAPAVSESLAPAVSGSPAPADVVTQSSTPAQPRAPEEIVIADPDVPRRKAAAPVVARAAQGVPLARTEDGQVLPRAYAARRRTPAEDAIAVAPQVSARPEQTVEPPRAKEAVSDTAAPEPVAVTPPAQSIPTPEPSLTLEALPTPDQSLAPELSPSPSEVQPVSPRPTPRSGTVPPPSEELRPVPPPPAANHVRAAIVTAVATVALALAAFVTFRGVNGHVTTESSGIAAPAASVLDSLPPLPFPLPDSIGSTHGAPDSTGTMAPEPARQEQRAMEEQPGSVAADVPRQSARPLPTRPRRRAIAPRRMRNEVALRDSARRADSIERDAIRRELEYRRARLDSIERSLEPDPDRPDS